jgi:hypothetical protein
MAMCRSLADNMGEWNLFKKDDKWAYHWKVLSNHPVDKETAIGLRDDLIKALAQIPVPDSGATSVRVLVEEVLGLWRSPFPG